MSLSVNFYMTETTAKLADWETGKQAQITLEADSVAALVEAASVPDLADDDPRKALIQAMKADPVKNPPSAKRERVLRIVTAGGAVLYQTDSHGLWKKSNPDEGFKTLFDKAIASPDEHFMFVVESVSVVEKAPKVKRNKAQTAEPTRVDI